MIMTMMVITMMVALKTVMMMMMMMVVMMDWEDPDIDNGWMESIVRQLSIYDMEAHHTTVALSR